jgi:hypothetical protein
VKKKTSSRKKAADERRLENLERSTPRILTPRPTIAQRQSKPPRNPNAPEKTPITITSPLPHLQTHNTTPSVKQNTTPATQNLAFHQNPRKPTKNSPLGRPTLNALHLYETPGDELREPITRCCDQTERNGGAWKGGNGQVSSRD